MKDFLKNNPQMYYHICLDEFQLEKTQRSQGDICYQFVNQLENIVRSTKERMRIFLIGNRVLSLHLNPGKPSPTVFLTRRNEEHFLSVPAKKYMVV